MQRALDWREGDIQDLENLVNDLDVAYNDGDDITCVEIRNACEELLYRERLPPFHRARILLWSQVSSNGIYPRMRTRI